MKETKGAEGSPWPRGGLQLCEGQHCSSVLLQAEPKHRPTRKSSGKNKPGALSLEKVTRSTQNEVEKGRSAVVAAEGQREFPLEEASETRSQAEAQGLAGSSAPSSTAQLRAKAKSQPPSIAATSVTADGIPAAAPPAPATTHIGDNGPAAQRDWEQHPGSSELLHRYTHTQRPNSSLAAPSNPASCPRAHSALTALHPATTRHSWGSVLASPLYLTCRADELPVALSVRANSCFFPPPPGPKGSFELPTGFSRSKTPPATSCNPQHSYTQRNSRSVV